MTSIYVYLFTLLSFQELTIIKTDYTRIAAASYSMVCNVLQVSLRIFSSSFSLPILPLSLDVDEFVNRSIVHSLPYRQ